MNPASPAALYNTPQELTGFTREFDWPLPKVPDHFTLTRRYAVNVDHYSALALDIPDTEFPNAYHVGETKERQADRLLIFRRLFATIPTPWVKPGATIIDIPGIQATPTIASSKSITAVVSSMDGIHRCTSSSHGFSAGDKVTVSLGFIGYSSGGAFRTYYFAGDYVVLTPDTNWFYLALGPLYINASARVSSCGSVVGTASKYTAGFPRRKVETRAVPIAIDHSYFLPGISEGINSRQDIILPPKFRIELGTEDEATFPANTVGAGTSPTASAYWDLIQSRADLVAGDAGLDTYLGNILVRTVPFYTAR